MRALKLRIKHASASPARDSLLLPPTFLTWQRQSRSLRNFTQEQVQGFPEEIRFIMPQNCITVVILFPPYRAKIAPRRNPWDPRCQIRAILYFLYEERDSSAGFNYGILIYNSQVFSWEFLIASSIASRDSETRWLSLFAHNRILVTRVPLGQYPVENNGEEGKEIVAQYEN